jgi:hyperosmotically inducible periplasmic protein
VFSLMSRAACLVLGTACLVACATGPLETPAEQQANKATVDKVEQALSADSTLYARHIIVRADNGVVRLTGFVWDQPDLIEAQRIAQSVPGVIRVVNALELQRNGVDNSGVTR